MTRLTYKDKRVCGGYSAVETDEFACVGKLGQLEDIEEELGIELTILLKALTQGFIYVDVKENNNGISEIEKFEVGGIVFDKKDKVWRLTNDDRYDGAYWGSIATNKNYGKTWALTKEELENNRIDNVIDKAVETATNRVVEREALEIIKKHGLSQSHLNLILHSENYGLYRRIIVGSHNGVFKYEIPYSREEFELIKTAFQIKE